MKKILVEWFYYDKNGSTCFRCGDGYETVKSVIDRIKRLLVKDIEIELKEIPLDESNIVLSNTVKINGRNIMDILGEQRSEMSSCPSCSELTGKETVCNTFTYKGKTYDALPEIMLVEAILREAGGGCGCC